MDLARYRTTFRRKVIPTYYRGRLHIAIFIFLELTALVSCGVMINWQWWTPLMILFSIFQASVLTYFIHRYLLHQKFPGFHWAHKMHHWHHTFYRPQNMPYDEINDIYMLLMPPWLQLVYFLIYLPLATLILAAIAPLFLILPFMFGLILWYGLYESVHWIEHLPKDHWAMRFRLFDWLRRHHITHHSELKDQANFGIVEPSMDYLFGTKY